MTHFNQLDEIKYKIQFINVWEPQWHVVNHTEECGLQSIPFLQEVPLHRTADQTLLLALPSVAQWHGGLSEIHRLGPRPIKSDHFLGGREEEIES
jgi:hypothetical protein